MKRYVVYCSYDPEMTEEAIVGSFDTSEEAIKAAQDKFKEVGQAYYGIYDNVAGEFIDFDEEGC